MYPAMTLTFSLESSSRGYHEYLSIWPYPTVDDELICKREVGIPMIHTLLLSKRTYLEYLQLWDTSLGRFLK